MLTDFSDLFAVECTVRSNQNKLQTIFKSFESRISQIDQHIKSLDGRCEHLQLSESSNQNKFGKFEQFTIDNLRLTVNQFNSLHINVNKYFGKRTDQYQTVDGTIVPISPIREFEDRLSQYNLQTREIVTDKMAHCQLSFLSKTIYQKQSAKLQNKISKQQTQLDNMVDHIRRMIEEKFEKCKSQLEKSYDKKVGFSNLKPSNNAKRPSITDHCVDLKLLKKVCPISEASNGSESEYHLSGEDLFGQQPSVLKLCEMESLSQKNLMRGISMGDFQDTKTDELVFGNRNTKQSHQKAYNEQAMKSYSRIKQSIYRDQFQNAKQTRLSNHLNSNSSGNAFNKQSTSGQGAPLSEETFQILKEKLKLELQQIFNQQMRNMKSNIEEITSKSELTEGNISFLMREFKFYKDDLQKVAQKSFSANEQISHLKHLLDQSQEKHLKAFARIMEHQGKLNHFELWSLNSQNGGFKENDAQEMVDKDTRKFKQIYTSNTSNKKASQHDVFNSLNTSNSAIKISTVKNPTSNSYFREENASIAHKFNSLSEKVSRLQEKVKNLSTSNNSTSQKNLPKLESSLAGSRNTHSPMMDQLRKDLAKTNEQLSKTNDRMQTLKKSLQQLETSNNQIPKKIQKLELDLHHINQIQQDRLIDLIKEIINRVLTDPFNNNFTNALKKEINVKFLEIKHEYSLIWKDIENRVMDRAEIGELDKLKDFIGTQTLEVRTLVHKKADNDDFRKGIKYLDNKLKDLYAYVKGKEEEEQNPTNTNKRYFLGAKRT